MDNNSVPVMNGEALVNLWAQQFADEFSNQVLALSAAHLQNCIADRRHSTQPVDSLCTYTPLLHSVLPATIEECIDFLQARLPNIKKKE